MGRALEVENIAPILQKLAGDEAVLQRVQRRARALLPRLRTIDRPAGIHKRFPAASKN